MACGYTASLSHNLEQILTLLTASAAIWFILCLKDLLCVCISSKKHEAHGCNLLIRILYECFFEIILCLLISHVIADQNDSITSPQTSSTSQQELKFFLLVLSALLPAFVCLLCYRFGPYIHNSYEKRSLAKSFWAFRPLR